MPKRVSIGKINLGGGQFVMPGEVFDFSAAQLKELEAMNPPVLRMPSEQREAQRALSRRQAEAEGEGEGEGEEGRMAPPDEEEETTSAAKTGNGNGGRGRRGRAAEL